MPVSDLRILHGSIQTWTLLGQVPFVLFIALIYLASRKNGWDRRRTVLATGAFVAGLSAGTALLPSVLGAMAGGITTWIVAQRILGLRQAPLIAMGLGLMGLVAIGRFGCLLSGCCFGILSDLPFAVEYGAGSHAFFLHESLGLLAPGATHSLKVHPYPLYESVGLFAGLPVAAWLSRRLRSEGAMLAFCAAYDLALRGVIDGFRGMVNVWWSLLARHLGLNLFQWTLLASSLAMVWLGIKLERRARRLANPVPAQTAPLTPLSAWTIYLGLCALCLACDSGQTQFLHRIFLIALALCIPALPMPRFLATRSRVFAGYAIAGLALLVLGLHLESKAVAKGDTATLGMRDEGRRWIYEVDPNRGLTVRMGNESTDQATLAGRETALSLPEPGTPILPAATRKARTWVGVGASAANGSYSTTSTHEDSSCGGPTYTTTKTWTRSSLAGYGQVEREIPFDENTVAWLGGRLGTGRETLRTTVTSSDPQEKSADQQSSLSTVYAQLWAEIEGPSHAGGMALLAHRGSDGAYRFRPGFHLRLGSPFIGLDMGYLDRLSFLAEAGGHAGLTLTIPRFQSITHPDDVLVRIFIGAQFFPGVFLDEYKVAPAVGFQIAATRRFAIGCDLGMGENYFFGGCHARGTFGD